MKPIVKGDFEGLFAFGLDAMLAFLLMGSLLIGFLGFSPELVLTRILPAAAIGLILGNVFYAWQALKLARRENRDDVCAIPYGTSTLTLVIYVFLVMFPTQQKLLGAGASKEAADVIAWHTGLLACMCSGLIEFGGAFFVHHIRRIVPRVVMLVAIAGTGLAFLAMDYVIRLFANPIVGLATLALVCVFYFGGVKVKGGIPGGFVVLATGTALAWTLHAMGRSDVVPGSEIDTSFIGLNMPVPEIWNVLPSLPYVVEFLPIIIPIAFIFLIGSLQNIEAAAAAGDSYRARPLLLMNGVGSFGAAAMGSPFPTSIFLGHPGYKQIGARAGYSTLNAIVWSIVCFTGTLSFLTWLVPIEAVMAIIIWIGVVVCAQNFQVSEVRHMPAVVVGLLPAFGAYVGLVAKHAMAVTGAASGNNFFEPGIEASFVELRSFYAEGLFALGQGYIFSSMVLAGVVYCIIERRFTAAAVWSFIGAALTLIGFIHLYVYTGGDIIGEMTLPALEWSKWTTGYVVMGAVLLLVPLFRHATESVPAEVAAVEEVEDGFGRMVEHTGDGPGRAVEPGRGAAD